MKNLTKIITIFILVVSTGCVMDHFEYFFKVKNKSKADIRIYFSNQSTFDTTAFFKSYTIIQGAELYRTHMKLLFKKRQYSKHPEKKLYMFVFDENKIKELNNAGSPSIAELANNSFLKREVIDILNITKEDTIYFVPAE